MSLVRARLTPVLAGGMIWFAAAAEAILAAEWPTWRGADRTAVSPETGLLDRWDAAGPPLAWQIDGLGRGYSSVAIAGGKAFTLGQRQGQAQLIAIDLASRKELWAARVGGGSPNSTPTVDGDLVFALGRDGDLLCTDANTGRELWRASFPRDFGGKMMSGWGYSESPLVDGNNLICTPGADDAIMAALNKRTGKVVWKTRMQNIGGNGGDGAAYSSPVISQAAGVKQYVQIVGRGLIGVSAQNGQLLWGYNRIANGTANIPTPLVKGDYVFCSTGYGTGAALLKVTRSGRQLRAVEQYFLPAKEMQNHHGGMILLGKYIYCGHGHNEGFPLCVDMETGKIQWFGGRGAGSGSAAVVYADGHIYFRYQDGTMALVEARPDGYNLKGKFKLASVRGESWPHPVISDGKLYLRDQEVLMCYDIAAR